MSEEEEQAMEEKKPRYVEGVGWRYETVHSMHRRMLEHDYQGRSIYMITMCVEGRRPLLGELRWTAQDGSDAHVLPTPLGEEVTRCWQAIPRFYPEVELLAFQLMPDHVHGLLFVTLEQEAHLGQIVKGFKIGCSKAWWTLSAEGGTATAGGGRASNYNSTNGTGTAGTTTTAATENNGTGTTGTTTTATSENNGTGNAGTTTTAATATSGATTTAATENNGTGTAGTTTTAKSGATTTAAIATSGETTAAGGRRALFEPGYHDSVLKGKGQLERMFGYIADNPRRLAVKRMNSGLFTVLRGMEVAGHRCQAVGNRFLLDVPEKRAVIVHRAYSDGEFERLRTEWLACGERGGVLVGTAIAPREKVVLREAMDRGYRIILLRENGFPPLYKPSGEAFEACMSGRLLMVSPWEHHMERRTVSRDQCLRMNALAERICGEEE